MYTLNGWWFLSSGGSYPPVFTVAEPESLASLGGSAPGVVDGILSICHQVVSVSLPQVT